MCSSQAISVGLMCLSSLIRAPAQHTLPSTIDKLEHMGPCLSPTYVLPLSKAMRHIHIYFSDITCAVYISTNCQWISTVWCHSHVKLESYWLLSHLSMLPVGLPSVNWAYCDRTHLSVASMAIWQHRWSTHAHYMVKSKVWCYFTGKTPLPYFWNLYTSAVL